MALQVSLDADTSPIGNAAPNAYVRIVLYTYDIKADNFFFVVEYHYNHAARNAGKTPLKGASYIVSGTQLSEAGGVRNNLYTYLKTLPEFTGALDV